MKFYFCLLEPKSMETQMNRSAHMNEDYFLIFYFKTFGGHQSFWGPLIPLFWTSGDVCPGFLLVSPAYNGFVRFASSAKPADLLTAKGFLIHILVHVHSRIFLTLFLYFCNNSSFYYLLKVPGVPSYWITASMLMNANNLFALINFHLFTRLLNA